MKQLDSDREREDQKIEKQRLAEQTKQELRDEKDRQREEAKAEHRRLELIAGEQRRELEEEREQERLRAATEAEGLVEEEDEDQVATGHHPLRKVFAACVLIIILAGVYAVIVGTKASVNPLQSLANSGLQEKLDRTIEFDHRNSGVEVSVYYKDAVKTSTIVFDLQDVRSGSKLDVFRVLLDFAEATKSESFSTLELAYRGDTKFKLDGYYVQELGRERSYQNPSYTIRTFPEHLKNKYDNQAYSEWTGGLLGVYTKQMEDFNDFHDKWYADQF